MRRSVARVSRTRIVLFGAAAAVAIAIACSVPSPDKATGPHTKADRVSASGKPMNANKTYVDFQIEKRAMPVAGNPAPQYPDALEQQRVSGEVLAQFVVDTTGRAELSTFKVIKASDPRFVDAVRSVLGSWKFTPAEVGGHKVKQLLQMPFAFKAP